MFVISRDWELNHDLSADSTKLHHALMIGVIGVGVGEGRELKEIWTYLIDINVHAYLF